MLASKTRKKNGKSRRVKKVVLAQIQGKSSLAETVQFSWPGSSNLRKQEVEKVAGEGSG